MIRHRARVVGRPRRAHGRLWDDRLIRRRTQRIRVARLGHGDRCGHRRTSSIGHRHLLSIRPGLPSGDPLTRHRAGLHGATGRCLETRRGADPRLGPGGHVSEGCSQGTQDPRRPVRPVLAGSPGSSVQQRGRRTATSPSKRVERGGGIGFDQSQHIAGSVRLGARAADRPAGRRPRTRCWENSAGVWGRLLVWSADMDQEPAPVSCGYASSWLGTQPALLPAHRLPPPRGTA